VLEVLGGFQEANPPDPPPARRLPGGQRSLSRSLGQVAGFHCRLWDWVLPPTTNLSKTLDAFLGCCALLSIHLTAAAALSLGLASKIVSVLDCGIEDLSEVVEV